METWEKAPAVGLKQQVMDKHVDIREVVTRFADKISPEFDADRLILFGSWARGNYQPTGASRTARKPRSFGAYRSGRNYALARMTVE